MKRILSILCTAMLATSTLLAQSNKREVYAPNINSNWYTQLGLDMSLQNPYGHKLKDAFPNGKTFGVNAAIGRWFTPEIGLRVRMNWENGIRLFENHHANWLAPFYQPGVNMDRGGYLVLTGDIPFNLHNLILGYKADRFWNLSVFPRAGVAYNFGVSKGSPLIAAGVHNTFRISRRFSIFLDGTYHFVSSGFLPSDVQTGTGTSANGYIDFSLGAQYNLGKSGFEKTCQDAESQRASKDGMEQSDSNTSDKPANYRPTICRSFWSGWFLQAGLDMTLHKPYRQHFSEVFPKGRTMGFNGAIGKTFSPEIAVRARLNWENGFPLFENKKLEWIAPAGANGINMDKGGYLTASLDVMLNATTLLWGYRETRKWNLLAFARAGLGSNLAIESASPMVGAGIETTYRIGKRLSLYADLAYQAITSEFYDDVSTTGMSVSTGHNGFFDLSVGVQVDLQKK